MTTPDRIQELIGEILQLEPELRGKEAQLERLLSELLQLDDRVQIDEKFLKRLKSRMLEAAPIKQNYSIKEIFTMKKFSFVIASLVLIAVGATGTRVYYSTQGNTFTPEEAITLFSKETNIISKGKNAFGALSAVNSVPQAIMADGQEVGARMSVSSDAAAPTPSAPVANNPVSSKSAIGYGGGGTDMMIAPYSVFKFVYKGDPLELTETEGTVYKRIKNQINTGGVMTDILRRITLGLLDLRKFQNTKLQSFTVMEDRDFGYMVTVNSQENSVYINENWERWVTPDRKCQDEACFQRYRIQPKDMPSDSEIINIANKFLDSYGIPRSNYGEPVVQKYWQAELMRSSDPASIYLPDTVNVVYPFKVGDQVVSDEGGHPSGMNVGVNIRVKRVSSVSDLSEPNYESSSYALETDAARVIKVAESFGYYGGPTPPAGTKEVALGTPTKALVRSWIYGNNASTELFVPALVFPVVNPSPEVYQKSVVVPLAKEILDQRAKMPQPIPFDGRVEIQAEPAPSTKPQN